MTQALVASPPALCRTIVGDYITPKPDRCECPSAPCFQCADYPELELELFLRDGVPYWLCGACNSIGDRRIP